MYLVIYRILSDSIIDCSLSGAFLSISDHFISIYWFQLLILFLSFGSPDDWECFLHYLGCLLEDDSNWCNRAITDPIYPSKFVECKISNLTDEMVHITLSLIVFFLPLKIEVVHVYNLMAIYVFPCYHVRISLKFAFVKILIFF